MQLKQLDINNLAHLNAEEKSQKIAEYEEEKSKLIQEYIRLQDLVDKYNEGIYEITCQVEQINLILQHLGTLPKTARR
jgi:hypothetical protein